jgi:hypothetical protein
MAETPPPETGRAEEFKRRAVIEEAEGTPIDIVLGGSGAVEAKARGDSDHSANPIQDLFALNGEQDEMLQEIDATIGRLDVGIAQENASLDKLLQRLTRAAA